ncbi:MAG: hypothetical protein OXF73_10610 [Gammaproteobacteria bacterium]|nr:hypothetical protein [Gammaproteobacteria bacterium]
MSYSYSFDRTTAGDISLMPLDWGTLHNALQVLLNDLMNWNQRVGNGGARKIPYEREIQDLYRIMTSISRKLKCSNDHDGFLVEPRVSIGSLRLKKAALILLLCRQQENIEDKKGEGWPSAALDSLNEEIKPVQELLEKQWLDYEPREVIWQLISKAQHEKVINFNQQS